MRLKKGANSDPAALSSQPVDEERGSLPLSIQRQFVGDGTSRCWTFHLPVRSEVFSVEKEVVVVEEVLLTVHPHERRVIIQHDARRERLRVDLVGNLAATQEAPIRRTG